MWYVPKLQRNLFSILAAQDKHENSCFISTSQICNLIVNDEKVIVGTCAQSGAVNNGCLIQMYHERLGHQNKRHVKSVIKRELDIDTKLCEGCVYGKAHRHQFGTRV